MTDKEWVQQPSMHMHIWDKDMEDIEEELDLVHLETYPDMELGSNDGYDQFGANTKDGRWIEVRVDLPQRPSMIEPTIHRTQNEVGIILARYNPTDTAHIKQFLSEHTIMLGVIPRTEQDIVTWYQVWRSQ